MAAFVKISQHDVGAGISRKDDITWTFVNTTVAEEQRIMRHGFAPIWFHSEELPEWMFQGMQKVLKRFFEQGVFLQQEDFDLINDVLRELQLPIIELVHDGNYSQPVMKGKFKPSKESWKANGMARLKEFREIKDQYESQVSANTSDLESFFG